MCVRECLYVYQKTAFSVSFYGLVKKATQFLSSKILGGVFTLRLDPQGLVKAGGTLGPLHGLGLSRGLKVMAGALRPKGLGGQSGPENLLNTTYFEKRGHQK